MLSPADLKQIRTIFKEEIKNEVPPLVRPLIRGEIEATVPGMIERGIEATVPGMIERGIEATVPGMIERGIEATVPGMIKEELKPIKGSLAEIKRDINMVIDYFDKEHLTLKKRVDNLEAFTQPQPAF